jgi:hypothetical protein
MVRALIRDAVERVPTRFGKEIVAGLREQALEFFVDLIGRGDRICNRGADDVPKAAAYPVHRYRDSTSIGV